jgi:hypothetical protein
VGVGSRLRAGDEPQLGGLAAQVEIACAASPARNSLPCRIGSTTNERDCSTSFLKIGPSCTVNPAGDSRAANSAQIRSSDQRSTSVAGSHWKCSRCTVGLRVETSTNPRSECA